MNYTSNCILSLNQQTSNNFQYYISSNTLFNDLLPNYVINTTLSNMIYFSSDALSDILTPYTNSNEIYYKQNVYSIEKEYPQIYDSVSTQTTTTFLGRSPVYTETLTLNTASYGNGDYTVCLKPD